MPDEDAAPPRLVASAWTSAGDASPRRREGRSPVALEDRVRAVAATGWDALALAEADLRDADLGALAEWVERHGLVVAELELLTDWWQGRSPRTPLLGRLVDAAGRLGAGVVKAAVELPAEARDLPRLASRLRVLADVVEAEGLRLALEPMAHDGSLPVVETVALVERVDRAAVGLCLDVWHVRRSGLGDADLLELLGGDADRLHVVELGDAPAAPRGDLSTDGIDHRLLPGQGDLDVRGFVDAVRRLGYRGAWSVEVLSERHRGLPVEAALAEARAAALAVLGS